MPAKKAATKTTAKRKSTATKKTTSRKTRAASTKTTSKTKAKKKAGDQEVSLDRRRQADRRDEVNEGDATQQSERREKVQRRRQIDPTTCERDYSEAEVQFMNAMDEYKRTSGRMFPTCSEVLEVIRGLGYVQLTPAEMAIVRPEPVEEEVAAESDETETEAFGDADLEEAELAF